MNRIADALKPFGYDYLIATVGIPGPGNIVVVFATKGDLQVACLTHDNKVQWCHSCGGIEYEPMDYQEVGHAEVGLG